MKFAFLTGCTFLIGSTIVAACHAPASHQHSSVNTGATGAWQRFNSEVSSDPSSTTAPHTLGAATAPFNPIASTLTELALTRFEVTGTPIPEAEDLRLVLQTAIHSLCTPDFERYHSLLTSRQAELNQTVNGECDQLRKFDSWGYSASEWASLSIIERARAYWAAAERRGAVWNAVDFHSLQVGNDLRQLPEFRVGRLTNYSFYTAPDGAKLLGVINGGGGQVAFVHFTVHAPRGTVPFTLCFVFHDVRRQWYPLCSMLDYSEEGPPTNFRI